MTSEDTRLIINAGRLAEIDVSKGTMNRLGLVQVLDVVQVDDDADAGDPDTEYVEVLIIDVSGSGGDPVVVEDGSQLEEAITALDIIERCKLNAEDAHNVLQWAVLAAPEVD